MGVFMDSPSVVFESGKQKNDYRLLKKRGQITNDLCMLKAS